MNRALGMWALAGVLGWMSGLGAGSASAQYGPGSPYLGDGYSRGYYGGNDYPGNIPAGAACSNPYVGQGQGQAVRYQSYSGGYGGGTYYPGNYGYRTPAPAVNQGYREGLRYWETGQAPHHRLSPAELQGFQAGERQAASTPWQLDPARQQGYREGQLYWETGLAPRHRLSPAELQGFQAGERRASDGGYRPY